MIGELDILTEKRGRSDSASFLADVLREIRQEDGRLVVLDLAAVEYLTSGGILVILSVAKQLQQTSGALVLVQPTDSALRVSGLGSSFTVYPDVDTAIEVLSREILE